MKAQGPISFEGARIGFLNFSGEEGPYNRKGDRNFVVFLNHEEAVELANSGWNVKFPKQLEDAELTRDPYLQVTVSFTNVPPKVILINGDQITALAEEEINMLDWAEIENVDLIVNPYHWTVNGNSGIKAYLKAIYVTLQTDEFTRKYGI